MPGLDGALHLHVRGVAELEDATKDLKEAAMTIPNLNGAGVEPDPEHALRERSLSDVAHALDVPGLKGEFAHRADVVSAVREVAGALCTERRTRAEFETRAKNAEAKCSELQHRAEAAEQSLRWEKKSHANTSSELWARNDEIAGFKKLVEAMRAEIARLNEPPAPPAPPVVYRDPDDDLPPPRSAKEALARAEAKAGRLREMMEDEPVSIEVTRGEAQWLQEFLEEAHIGMSRKNGDMVEVPSGIGNALDDLLGEA